MLQLPNAFPNLNFPSRHINHCSNAINKLLNERGRRKSEKKFSFQVAISTKWKIIIRRNVSDMLSIKRKLAVTFQCLHQKKRRETKKWNKMKVSAASHALNWKHLLYFPFFLKRHKYRWQNLERENGEKEGIIATRRST